MLSKAIILSTAKPRRRSDTTGLTLLLIIFGLLFAVALASAIAHPEPAESYDILARL